MRLLLDTHAVIWSLYRPSKLPIKLRRILEDSSINCAYSSISALEISVKISIGKLNLEIQDFLSGVKSVGFEEAPFLSSYAVTMIELPLIHSDPFDRALIAQSLGEKRILVTCDENIRKYPEQLKSSGVEFGCLWGGE